MNISSITEEEFEYQFREFLDTDIATSKFGIVYFWKVFRPIPRVVGENKTIYIGQTSGSFKGRYGAASNIKIEKAYFNRFYKEVIDKYGPISIEI